MVGVCASALSPMTATAKDASRLDLRAFFMFCFYETLIAREKPGSIIAPILFGPSGPERLEKYVDLSFGERIERNQRWVQVGSEDIY